MTLDPQGWLENFAPEEQGHAVQLLDSFLFYSDVLVDEMFAAAFQSLSTVVVPRGEPFPRAQSMWRAFVDSVFITYPTGENPSITDSGIEFAKKARQILGISEDRIQPPEVVLETLFKAGTPFPVVFVDDFVGTGHQFITTWKRAYNVPSESGASFQRFASARKAQFYYCPVLCTSQGFRDIQVSCAQVHLAAAHVLPLQYSALVPDSLIWPTHLQPSAFAFLHTASKRAGIPDTNGLQTDDWQGYRKLGLTIAIDRSIPDATLPIFYWERNGWKPLMRRK